MTATANATSRSGGLRTVVENIARKPDGSLWMERFCPGMTFKRPMDLELGADGCLYLIEFGTAWGNNKDTQIVRIEHHGPQ